MQKNNNKCVCISLKGGNSQPYTMQVGQMLNPEINLGDPPKDCVEE